uniref:Alpha-carbonic anhydrase domain-containing protein n=1 Tax=Meloidogyne javanica TaxID=6303 RepID=A0A915MX45_MELJA
MAFLNQIQTKLQEIKTKSMPQVSAVLEQANQATNKAKQNLLPANVNPKQSPIDLLPAITAFDPSLENATFKLSYENSVKLTVENLGQYGGLSVRWPNNLNNTAEINGVEQQKEGNSSSFECSFLEGQQFQLEQILFHWGTEPMNGSLHTIAGVGYAGEIHIIHRNTKFPNMTEALKHPEEQGTLFIGTECSLSEGFKASQLVPLEKSKEFWFYEGSEAVEPFRETVQWLICRSAISISSNQLEKLRELRKSRQEDEVEQPLLNNRPLQPAN